MEIKGYYFPPTPDIPGMLNQIVSANNNEKKY
jgi:hypothetical protein